MAITIDDFSKIWASTSPLTPYSFSESQYKEGWNFIGGTPPSRQMWDFLQKNNDEKMQYLADNYLPLSGGTLTGDVLGVTPPNGDNSKKLANTEFIQALASILVPVGCVQAFAGNTLPNGWLLCDGSAVSRIDYADLYAVIGTTYGSGDGSTTFNLPDLSNGAITKEFTDPNNVLKNSSVVEIDGGFKFLGGGHLLSVGINTEGVEDFPAFCGYKSEGSVNGTVGYGSGLKINMSNTFNTLKQSYQVSMRYIIKY